MAFLSLWILLVLAASASSQVEEEADPSIFLVPALFSRGNCSAVPYPQTLTIYLTTQQQEGKSRAFLVASGKSTTRFLWSLARNNLIENVFEYGLLELHHLASSPLFCLNYYCDESPTSEIFVSSNGTCFRKNGASGVYAWIDQDPTISFVVSNKGPDFMLLYAALPFTSAENTTYHILHPTRHTDNYVQAFALRAVADGITEVTFIPTSPVKIFQTPMALEMIVITRAEAYSEVVLHLLPFQTVWVEVEVESCDSLAQTLTGTVVKSSYEIMVHSAQALCNETLINSTHGSHALSSADNSSDDTSSDTSLAFSFVLNPIHQLPPVHRWGTLYISDLNKLKLFSIADMEFYILSFSIVSATESEVSITCRSPRGNVCEARQLLGEGEIWQYRLQANRMLEAEAVVIRGTGPVLVLHEVYSHGRQDRVIHAELLQAQEWFSNRQAVPVARSLGPEGQAAAQQYVISLVIPNKRASPLPEEILVWDNMERESPSPLDDYQPIQNYSYSTVDDHTLVHLVLDPTTYEGRDYVVRFSLNDTGRLGASIFSSGGYAFSNGYILATPSEELVEENRTNSTTVATTGSGDGVSDVPEVYDNKNFATVLGPVIGTASILLVIAVCVSALILCHRKGLSILPWLPPPPRQGFEYDVFLSFADEDRDFAQKVLYESLTKRGYRVLLHLTDFIAGMTIEDNIVRAVDISRVVVYVCSKSFNESRFCLTELKHGMESHYGKYGGRCRRVVPVWIGGECPPQLNTYKIRPIKISTSLEGYDNTATAEVVKMLKLGKPIHSCRKKQSHNRDATELYI